MITSMTGKHLSAPHAAFRLGCGILALLILSNSPAALAVGFGADFDANGILDCADANLLTAEIASGAGGFAFDLNADGLLNGSDLDEWFSHYSAFSGVPLAVARVDVNFDRVNTLADFQVIQSHLTVATTDLTDGNLNADGLVDARDMSLYTSLGGVVPEPACLLVLALGGLGLPRRRRG